MASSNIKLFDENKGNMLTDTEFNVSTQRLNGLQTGVASSQLQNKAMYQASLVAYAIAQVMMQNGKNANDTDAVSAFVANLSGTMLQKVYDIATTAEAQAGVATGKWMSPALVKAAIDALAAKAQNVLSDTTKALYGLDSSAVPDDVLMVLSRFQNGLGNEYVWEKSKSHDEYKYDVVNTAYNAYTGATNMGYTTYIPYGDGFTVNSNGEFELTNRQEFIFAYNSGNESELNVLAGKYFFQGSGNSGILSRPQIINCPIGSTVMTENGQFKMRNCDMYANGKLVTVKTIYGYLNSPDHNAYPPTVPDGYTYTLLGQLGAKVQIKAGSYTGTGTYSSNNKNILTFDFEPLLLIVDGGGTIDFGQPHSLLYIKGAGSIYGTGGSNYQIIFSANGNTVSWYNSNSANDQLNNNGTTYHYIAIG